MRFAVLATALLSAVATVAVLVRSHCRRGILVRAKSTEPSALLWRNAVVNTAAILRHGKGSTVLLHVSGLLIWLLESPEAAITRVAVLVSAESAASILIDALIAGPPESAARIATRIGCSGPMA